MPDNSFQLDLEEALGIIFGLDTECLDDAANELHNPRISLRTTQRCAQTAAVPTQLSNSVLAARPGAENELLGVAEAGQPSHAAKAAGGGAALAARPKSGKTPNEVRPRDARAIVADANTPRGGVEGYINPPGSSVASKPWRRASSTASAAFWTYSR